MVYGTTTRNEGRATRIVCAVIGLLAVAGTLAIAFGNKGSNDPFGLTKGPNAINQPPATSTGESVPGPNGTTINSAVITAEFPFPSGSQVTRTLTTATGIVPLEPAAVRSYYATAVPRLDPALSCTLQSRDVSDCNFCPGKDPDVCGTLSMSPHIDARGNEQGTQVFVAFPS